MDWALQGHVRTAQFLSGNILPSYSLLNTEHRSMRWKGHGIHLRMPRLILETMGSSPASASVHLAPKGVSGAQSDSTVLCAASLLFGKSVLAHVQMHGSDRALENSFKLQSIFYRNNDFIQREEQSLRASLPHAMLPPMHRLSSGKPAAS